MNCMTLVKDLLSCLFCGNVVNLSGEWEGLVKVGREGVYSCIEQALVAKYFACR